MAWSSIVPKSYKCRTTIGHFHWSKQVSMNFAGEDKHIKTKFLKADYVLRIVLKIILITLLETLLHIIFRNDSAKFVWWK